MKTDFRDLADNLYDYFLERRHVVLCCVRCGQLLAPFIELAGPKGCGWKKIGHKWICHQCYFHDGGWWDGSQEDRKQFQEDIEKKNSEIRRKLIYYKFRHSWIKIKQI